MCLKYIKLLDLYNIVFYITKLEYLSYILISLKEIFNFFFKFLKNIEISMDVILQLNN